MMPDAGRRRVTLPGVTLEVDVRGSGEPVVLIQTALIADEFEPVAGEPPLRDNYTVVLYQVAMAIASFLRQHHV